MKCYICAETLNDGIGYFLRRNWRTKRWTVVRKWQRVGHRACKPCAERDAKNGNAVKESQQDDRVKKGEQ